MSANIIEGLTQEKRDLIQVLLTRETLGKATRRRINAAGEAELYKEERHLPIVAFAQDENEFFLKKDEGNPNAIPAPVFINLRNLGADVNDLIGQVLSQIPLTERPDLAAGIPDAALPFMRAYEKHAGIPVEEIFDKEQIDAVRRRIVIKPGIEGNNRGLLIGDDLVSAKAQSKLEAAEVAVRAGFRVLGFVIVLDRQEGGVEVLQAAGYDMRPAIRLDDVLQEGIQMGKISLAQQQRVLEYRQLQK